MTDLLSLRNKSKAKKPRFERGQSGIMPQLRGTWRRPRGVHNKMRLGLRGKRVGPAVGYSSPKGVKGLERNGIRAVLISNLQDLDTIKQNEAALLSSTLGQRKKTEIVKKALEKKINILNLKDPQAYLQEIEQSYKKKGSKKEEVEPELKEQKK